MIYAKEFGYAGHMLPVLITYMIIHHTDLLRDNSIDVKNIYIYTQYTEYTMYTNILSTLLLRIQIY